MPLVSCRSNVFATEKSYLLRAAVTHTLSVLPEHLVEFEGPKAGSPPVRLRTTTVPSNLDVRLPGSQLSLRIHGFVYGKCVGSESIVQSGLLFEFKRFVLKNMDIIGLETASGPFVDEDCVKFVMTPRGAYDPPVSSPSDVPPVYLHQVDIDIMWGTKARIKDSTSESSQSYSRASQDTRTSIPEKDLFNSHMDVDDVTPWLQIMEKMFATHFIRRYPLIFGEWKLSLAAESAFFPSIARSIAAILLRSNNKALKSQGKKTFNTLQTHRNRVVDGSWAALSLLRASSGSASVINDDDASNYRYSLPQNDRDLDGDDSQQLLFEKAICNSMRRLYRLNVRPGKRLKFAGKGPDGADLEEMWLTGGEGRADDVIRALDEEDLPFDSPVPSLPAIQQHVRGSREVMGDNMSDIHPPTERSRTTDSLDLEDDLEPLMEDTLDTDSLLLSDDDDVRPATPTTTTCLPISSPQIWMPQIWTGSDDEMDLDLLSPLCAVDAPSLPIDSVDDRKAQYAQLASPSPSLSSGGRMLLEFDETVVWRA